MNEALCSILSGEDEWCYDTDGRTMKFNQDGTGELWCRCNFNYWIAAVLEWKSVRVLRDPNQAAAGPAHDKGPQLLGQLELEMTLIKRLPKWVESSILSKSTLLNELSLTDEAFRPRSYRVRVERGNFMEPSHVGYSSSGGERFALRLLFDRSPYPPRAEWRQPEGGPDGGQFWDHVEFVSRRDPALAKQGKAMNDVSARRRSGCVVS